MVDFNYLRPSITLMYFGAIYKIHSRNKIKKILFYSWRIFANLLLLYLIFAVSADLVQKKSLDITLTVLNYLYFVIGLCVLLKLNYFYAFDEDTEEIANDLQRLFKYETRTGLDEKDLRQSMQLCRKMTIIWFTSATVTAQSILLLPLIFNRSQERILTLPLWFPYNWKASPFYEFTIFYEMVLQQIIAITMTGMDMFFASTIILTAKQFEFLGWEIKHLLYTTLIRNGFDKQMLIEKNPQMIPTDDTLVNGHVCSEQIRADLLKRFAELVRFHQTLLKFCDRLDDFFSPAYLTYFVMVIIIDILLGYILTSVDDLALAMTFSTYLLSANCTLFFACYFGHLLTVQAEALHDDVYESPWYVHDEQFKGLFKCLQLKTCKPIYMTVGKFANLSLSAYLWSLQTVTSYVVVLHQVTHAKDKYQ